MSKRAKRIALLLGAVAVVAAVATAVAVQKSSGKTAAPAAARAPAPKAAAPADQNAVRTVQPRKGEAPPELRLPATAEAFADARLYARINGFVAQQRAELGDRVAAGQVLAVIDAPEVERGYERAKAALAQVDARLELSRSNLDRTQRLVDQRFLSRASLDERNAELQVASADRNAAAAEVRRLGELLNFRTIRAPFAGVITERRAERGNLVAGDQPQADAYLYRVSRVDRLRVAVDVPQSAARSIRAGTPVEVVFPDFPGQVFTGEVARSADAIDPRSGTMRVEVTLPNPGGTIPSGMAGQVILRQPAGTPRYVVPVNALVTGREGPRVALVRDGTVRFVPVQVGRNLGQSVELLSGVDDTARVILSPNALLREGDRVHVIEAAAGG